ncbi:MAG: adenylate kinase, partial [Clostridia bacterium]|nr:adenylate kinase [Clostridia bacterium]
IVEGCYVPFGWRRDFESGYLSEIRFICLAMTEKYIDGHFDEIIKHASDIENRLYDDGFTPEKAKMCNKVFIEGYKKSGERVTLIENDFPSVLQSLLDEQL